MVDNCVDNKSKRLNVLSFHGVIMTLRRRLVGWFIIRKRPKSGSLEHYEQLAQYKERQEIDVCAVLCCAGASQLHSALAKSLPYVGPFFLLFFSTW